jgi:hypothetical protein
MSTTKPFIPGLVRGAYIAGSRHSADTPELIHSKVNGNAVDFKWEAVGSSVYTITAKGEVQCTATSHAKSLKVVCSCPDGARQELISRKSRELLYVCKHAKAALDSVLDDAANDKKENREAAVAQNKKEAEKRKKFLLDQHQMQDREMPGERERINYGLSKWSDADIANVVKQSALTVEGLRALSTIFPNEIMPCQKSVVCGRCGEEYDPQIPSDSICREEHPPEKCRTMWDGSKKSWEHCRRCGKDFGLDGFHSWGKRKRDDPDDEGPYCYETTHVPEDEYDEDDDSVIRNLDNSDY